MAAAPTTVDTAGLQAGQFGSTFFLPEYEGRFIMEDYYGNLSNSMPHRMVTLAYSLLTIG